MEGTRDGKKNLHLLVDDRKGQMSVPEDRVPWFWSHESQVAMHLNPQSGTPKPEP